MPTANEENLRAYRIGERRALLQSVRACETLLAKLALVKLTLAKSDIMSDNEGVQVLAEALSEFAENQRKALLQSVRATEKAYGIRKAKAKG